MKLLKAVIGCTLFAVFNFASAGFDEGVAAYKQGDFKTSLDELRPLAEQGNADAQVYLGHFYAEGKKGVQQNSEEALKWYRLAAEQGNVEAQLVLAWTLGARKDAPSDYIEAYAWASVAAANDSETMSAMGASTRDLVGYKLTSEQLSQAQDLATKYFEKSQPKP